jgi:hypothetical protein
MFILNFVVQFLNKRHFSLQIGDIAPLTLVRPHLRYATQNWSPPSIMINLVARLEISVKTHYVMWCHTGDICIWNKVEYLEKGASYQNSIKEMIKSS